MSLLGVPGHCGPGNELADLKAKTASQLQSSAARPISLSSAISRIKQIITDPPIQHARTAAVYVDYSVQRFQERMPYY